MDVPMLGASQAKARTQQRKETEEPEVIEAVTAFLVIITKDGRIMMHPDIDAIVVPDRPPTKHEVIAAAGFVADDVGRQITIEATTMNVVGNFNRMQTDPDYQMAVRAALAQATAAANLAAPGMSGK